MAVTLTPTAAQHVAANLNKRGKGVGLRLGVRTTGCSGLAYKLEYADETKPEDVTFVRICEAVDHVRGRGLMRKL